MARRSGRIVAASAASGSLLDVQALFARYTLDAIGHIGFGVTIGCLEDGEAARAFSAAFDAAQQSCAWRFLDPFWRLKKLLRLGNERDLHRALVDVNDFASRVVAERRTLSADDLGSRGDLLSRFMLKGFGDGELRDVVINFVIAGRDTTAILLTWAAYELARHPEAVAALRDEARAAAAGGEVGYDAVTNRMPLLKSTLTEVLRLHPSVPADLKTAVRDDTLPDGTRVHKGDRVMFAVWAMGRQPSLWPEPETFDPRRFLDDGAFRFPPAASFPVFFAGPRTCLGKDMAYLGAGLLLTSLLARFDLQLAEGREVTYGTGVTLWVHGGLHVRFRERERAQPPAEA